jgi:GH35 family endo-1,4-beta-xylanase
MKHKHAELIKAWAEGAEIQVKAHKLVWEDRENPLWDTDSEYRIKPEEEKTVVKYLWAIDKGNGFKLHHLFVDEQSIPYFAIRYPAKRLDWSRTEFEE